MSENNSTERSGIYYRKTGSGPAIILLHGFPASGGLWHNIWDGLSVSNTVITPDLPGSGNSPLKGAASISDMAEMIKEIMDREQLERAVIAGHSMGGYIALAFAGLYPQKVTGLSLVHSTTDADDDEKIKTRQKAIALIEKGGKQGFINQMVPNLFSDATKQAHAELIREQIKESMEIQDASMINFYKAMIERKDTTQVVSNASFPVQWICGMDDNVIPYKKILNKSYKADINFVSFYINCGHMSMQEAPLQLASDLASFTSYCYTMNTRNA
jgi:pimeloyl-ACP methyl ester carboxylesterase